MKRVCSVLVLTAVAIVALAPAAWAADIQGKIKGVDASGRNIKASYEEKDGQKVATSFTVTPAAPAR